MLGIGREEILECEERYGQRKKGKKSSLGKTLDKKLLLGMRFKRRRRGREDSSNARQEVARAAKAS